MRQKCRRPKSRGARRLNGRHEAQAGSRSHAKPSMKHVASKRRWWPQQATLYYMIQLYRTKVVCNLLPDKVHRRLAHGRHAFRQIRDKSCRYCRPRAAVSVDSPFNVSFVAQSLSRHCPSQEQSAVIKRDQVLRPDISPVISALHLESASVASSLDRRHASFRHVDGDLWPSIEIVSQHDLDEAVPVGVTLAESAQVY
jgi:hypothetical protein